MIKRLIVFLAALLAMAGTAAAMYFESDAETILSFPIEGVTLSMSPAEARAAAEEAGYQQHGTIGVDTENPVGWQYWSSSANLTFLHRDGVLTSIELTVFPSVQDFDFKSEIERMRRHFGASESEKWCWVQDQGGICSVKDGARGNLFVVMRARPTGLDVRATRP